MKKTKKIVAFSIIFASLLTAIFIIGKSALRPKSGPPAASNNGNITLNSALLASPIEQLPANSALINLGSNSTQELAKKITLEIIKKNENGPFLSNGERAITAIKPDELINNYLGQELAAIDYQKFIPEVDYKNTKITQAQNKTALENYFKAFQATIKRGLASAALDLNNLAGEDLLRITQALDRAIQELKELSVPVSLIALHAQEISLLTAQKNIFTAISNYNQDPLNAFTAFQALAFATDEVNKLSSQFEDFAIKNNLQF